MPVTDGLDGIDGIEGLATQAAALETSLAGAQAMTAALIRSCSDGVTPVVGSVVMSPTLKMPNCMPAPK